MTKPLLITLVALAFFVGSGLGALITVRHYRALGSPPPVACETCWRLMTPLGLRCSFYATYDLAVGWPARSDDQCYAVDAPR